MCIKAKSVVGVLFCLVLLLSVSCKKKEAPAEQVSFAGKNVRVVIGSTSTSADSYLIAETVSRYLGKELNANLKVDAVGAARALDAMQTSPPDGNTIMLFHDMTYLGVSFKAYDDIYKIENMTIGPRAAQNPATAWATYKDAPYNTMAEIPEYLKNNPTASVRFALEGGGTTHLCFVVFYDWVNRTYGSDIAKRLYVIVAGSTGDRIQILIDRNADVIAGDYSAFLDYTRTDDAKIAMKLVSLLENVPGVNTPSYADMGITLSDGSKFAFPKDFVFYFPKDFPASLVAEIDKGMEKVAQDPQFNADMAKMAYKGAYLSSADAKAYIYGRRDALQALIDSSPSLDDLVQK